MTVRRVAVLVLVGAVAAGCGWVPRTVEVTGARISPDGLTLELSAATCGAGLTVEVTEDRRALGVEVLARGGGEGDCTDTVVVELLRPLGGRALVDLSRLAEVEVVADPSVGSG